MIPLYDNIRIRKRPFITIALILLNTIIFYQEIMLDNSVTKIIIENFGLIPQKFITSLTSTPLDFTIYYPLFSNMFLHGNIMHYLSNMWFLWLFGRTSEACLGRIKYIFFYVVCGLLANFVQIIVNHVSSIPIIGASGAISGILGSYIICFPKSKIATLIPLVIVFPIIEIPALLYIGFWFLIQLYNGTTSLIMNSTNVAWWAHVGGFISGIYLSKLLHKS